MKNILSLLLISCAGMFTAQTHYLEAETRMEGAPAMFAKMVDTKMKVFAGNNKTMIVTDAYAGKMYMLTKGDSVTFVNGRDCYADSKENISKVNKEQATYSDVQVTKNNEKKVILNYECNSATIKYKVKSGGVSSEQTMLVWYSKQLKEEYKDVPAPNGTETENDLTKALSGIDGVILYTESYMGAMKTIMEVLKIEKKEFSEDQFKIETKKCSKMRTYKEFAAEMNRRSAQNSAGGFKGF